jgi:group I intron endonuclease
MKIFIIKERFMIGIYRIKNKINEKCYYGSSKNIEKRWKTHLNQLRNKKHVNCILQNAWNKYGEDNFIFEIVEECELEILFDTEQKYLDTCGDYNIGLKAIGGDNISKNPNKNIIVENIRKGNKLWMDNLSDEEIKERFSKPLEKNPNWKGGSSFVYCDCGKRIGYGHTYCQKCRPRNGKNNPFFGKKHSQEFLIKLKEKMIGNIPQNRLPVIINDIEYESYKNASEKLNIPVTTIRWRVKSKNPKYKNYYYKGEKKIFYSKEEQKERISNPQKGKQTKFNKPFLIDDFEYRTLKDASEKLNIHPMTIKGRLKSEKFDNYKYKN